MGPICDLQHEFEERSIGMVVGFSQSTATAGTAAE
jgi:hypothetical protein